MTRNALRSFVNVHYISYVILTMARAGQFRMRIPNSLVRVVHLLPILALPIYKCCLDSSSTHWDQIHHSFGPTVGRPLSQLTCQRWTIYYAGCFRWHADRLGHLCLAFDKWPFHWSCCSLQDTPEYIWSLSRSRHDWNRLFLRLNWSIWPLKEFKRMLAYHCPWSIINYIF